MIQMSVSLNLIDDIFYLWVHSKQLSYMFFSFLWDLMPFSGCSGLRGVKPSGKEKSFLVSIIMNPISIIVLQL